MYHLRVEDLKTFSFQVTVKLFTLLNPANPWVHLHKIMMCRHTLLKPTELCFKCRDIEYTELDFGEM